MHRLPSPVYNALLLSIFLSGCHSLNQVSHESLQLGYQPVEPIPIQVCDTDLNELKEQSKKRNVDGQQDDTSGGKQKDAKPSTHHINVPVQPRDILRALPHESMRLAIAKVNRSLSATYTPAALGVAGETYLVVLDYIKFYPRPLQITFNGTKQIEDDRAILPAKILDSTFTSAATHSIEVPDPRSGFHATRGSISNDPYRCSMESPINPHASGVVRTNETAHRTLPIYLGIGLRLKALVQVLEGNVNLSSFYGLGIAAQEKRVFGSLQIETLGISGPAISPLIPMPSDLNVSTVQQAIQALATIKSKIYDSLIGDPERTSVHLIPSIVGLDNHIGSPGSTEQIISILLEKPQEFNVHEYLVTHY